MASLVAHITGMMVQYLSRTVFTPDLSIAQQRRRLEYLQRLTPSMTATRRQDIQIAGIPAWQLTPTNPRPGRLLYLHGGGYVMCSPQSHGGMVSHIAKTTALTTVLINYRLAPEHPFPAGLNDALSVYKALIETGEPVFIAGDSAGGGMALALMQNIREQGLQTPEALLLLSPWTDLTCSGDSLESRAHRDKFLTPDWIRQIAGCYATQDQLTNPLVSPLYADFKHFPPVLIQVGTDEILYDDSSRLYDNMKEAGVTATLSEYPGMWHVFQTHAGYMPESQLALREMTDFIDALV